MSSDLDDIFAEFADKKTPPPKKDPPPKEEPEKPKKEEKKTKPKKEEAKAKPKEKEKPTPEKKKKKTKPKPKSKKETDEVFANLAEDTPQETDLADATEIHTKISKGEVDIEFDLSPEEVSQQRTCIIYGFKGNGKTELALSFEGKIAVISFDRKTTQIKELRYDGDERITVFDGIRYLNQNTTELWMESAEKSFRYINKLLEGPIKEMRPDHIVIDGTEIFIRDICEMNMRWQENLKAFEGFANLNLWKERNMFANQVHNLCLKLAKKGVIYTAYINDKKIKIVGGNIVEQRREPKWAANIKTQVGTVIYVESEQTEDGKIFWATVESSKTPEMKTGVKVDITDKGVKAIIEASKK